MIKSSVKLAGLAAVSRRRRWLPLVIVIAIGLAIVSVTVGLAGHARSAAAAAADRDGAGRVVEIDVVDSTTRLTARNLERLRQLQGVQSVAVSIRVPLGLKTDSIPGVLLHTAVIGRRTPPLTAGTYNLQPGDVIVPQRVQGSDLKTGVGKRFTFESQRAVGIGKGEGAGYRLRIVGTYDSSYQVDGADTAYITESDAVALAAMANGVSVHRFRREIGFERAEVSVSNAKQVPKVLSEVQKLGLPATTLAQRYQQLPAALALTQIFGRVLGAILIILVGGMAASQTAASVRSRWTEIGVLRAVGFGRLAVMATFTFEVMIALTIGALLGLILAAPLGFVVSGLIGNAIPGAGVDLSDFAGLIPIVSVAALTLFAGTLGSATAAIRAARLDPSLVLRGG